MCKTACICLNIATLAQYEKVIEKLVLQWPKAWGLIAQADDKARAEKLETTRRQIILDMALGSAAPREYTDDSPLDGMFWRGGAG